MLTKRQGIVAIALAVGLLTGRCTVAGDEKPTNPNNPIAVIETSKGTIEAELYADKAPISTKNFVDYAKSGHYDGTIFHRVIPNFMIQGGGFTPDMKQKETKAPIKNEAGNGLTNERGTLAMARTAVVDSATSQFFVNHRANDFLNHKDKSMQGFGYAVFGKVLSGMKVVDEIANVERGSKGGHEDVPLEPVVIQSVKIRESGAK
jgi:peptidyl-prolyl cis-trans isomerase A (cyclophilin A)